jgi:autotransporter adhesin
MLAAPTFAVQGSDYYNVRDAFSAIDGSITDLYSRVFSLEATPGLGLPIGTGDGLAIGGDSNAVDATDTAFGAGANVGADSGTAIGSNANIATVATNSVAVGADSNVTAASGTAIGAGASVTANNAVAIGQGSVANQANTVSVGSVGHERRVTNVAAGTASTDAANVGQVQASAANTLSSANAYTDGRMQQVMQLQDDVFQRLDQQDERIDREGAMQSAMSMMIGSAAGIDAPNRLATGTGFQGGEAAISVGYQRAFGPKNTLTIGASVTESESTWGVGYGIGW